MHVEQMIVLAAKLLTWMETDVPGESEPTAMTEPISDLLAREIRRKQWKNATSKVEKAAVAFVEAVLAVHAEHVHAEPDEDDT